MNRNQIAAALGVSPVTISSWTERENMPCERRGRRGVACNYDLAACKSWLLIREALQRGARASELAGFYRAFALDLDDPTGPVGTTTADVFDKWFGWTWSDVRELIAFALPFVTAGEPHSATGWTFPAPLLLPWCAATAEALKRNRICCEVQDLPSALRGLRIHAGAPLVTPSGYRDFDEMRAERERFDRAEGNA